MEFFLPKCRVLLIYSNVTKHQLTSGDAQALFPIDRWKCLLFMIKTHGDTVTERTFQQQLHHQEKFFSRIMIIGLGKCFFLPQLNNLILQNEVYNIQLLLLLLRRFNHVRLYATLQTAAHQAPPSLGFSRQEHWSGLPFPSPMHESEK